MYEARDQSRELHFHNAFIHWMDFQKSSCSIEAALTLVFFSVLCNEEILLMEQNSKIGLKAPTAI